ncbi:outer membrane beta-barrel protein [Legionella geestiana]|nr:outer membrane beta-barrel protein [Legionella geestiana]
MPVQIGMGHCLLNQQKDQYWPRAVAELIHRNIRYIVFAFAMDASCHLTVACMRTFAFLIWIIMNRLTMLAGSAWLLMAGEGVAGTHIWGLENIPKTRASAPAPYTVHIGSYASRQNAKRMQASLQKQGYPASIHQKGALFVVTIGPVATLAGLSQAPLAKHTPHTPAVAESHKEALSSPQNPFFIQVFGGANFPSGLDSLRVQNGSEYPFPQNVDTYSTRSTTTGSVGLAAGRRFATTHRWIRDYSLGGRLQYVFPADIGGTITQYSLSQFENYHYRWKLSALALTADAKLNFMGTHGISPYASGGLGASFNRAASFRETANAGVTPRISPAFADRNATQFAWHAGAGLDFFEHANWLVSAGYEYESFGDFASGKGQSTWSGESLRAGTLSTNTILFGITRLID